MQNQRNSWHGVDFPYHGTLDIARLLQALLPRRCSRWTTASAACSSYLRGARQLDSTLVIYMGDNGFAFGEHGLIDKRTAYEESMRVPMLMHCPELFKGGTRRRRRWSPTSTSRRRCWRPPGCEPPAGIDGHELPAARAAAKQRAVARRPALRVLLGAELPADADVHALRGDRYKYIRYHGVWDIDELYDLQDDPLEMKNLIDSPEHRPVVQRMNRQLFDLLEQTGGMSIPLYPDRGPVIGLRAPGAERAAPFPPVFIARPGAH